LISLQYGFVSVLASREFPHTLAPKLAVGAYLSHSWKGAATNYR